MIEGAVEVFTGYDLATEERLGYWRFAGLIGLSEARYLDKCNTLYRSIGGNIIEEVSHFDPQKLERILAALKLDGVHVIRGKLAEAFLEAEKAKAAYYPLPGQRGVIFLGDNPSTSEVIEELIHLGQHRLSNWKFVDRYQKLINEVRAQRYLLDYAHRLGLTPAEIKELREAQEYWFKELNDYLELGK